MCKQLFSVSLGFNDMRIMKNQMIIEVHIFWHWIIYFLEEIKAIGINKNK